MSRQIKNFFIIILAILPILYGMQYTLAYASVPSGVTYYCLNGNICVPQQKDNWCWVACAESTCIIENHHSYNQYYAVQTLKGTIDNPYPDVAGNVQDVANAVGVISSGYLSYSYGLDLSFSYIADKVYNSHPVTAALIPTNILMGGGHDVLIIGWSTTSGTEKVIVYNPAFSGSIYTCDYDSFHFGTCIDHYYLHPYSASAYKN